MHVKNKSLDFDFMDILSYFFSTRGSTRTLMEELIATCLRFKDSETGRACQLSAYKANACSSRWLGFCGFRLIFVSVDSKAKNGGTKNRFVISAKKKITGKKDRCYIPIGK